MTTRVLIVDDHEVVLEGVKAALMEVLGRPDLRQRGFGQGGPAARVGRIGRRPLARPRRGCGSPMRISGPQYAKLTPGTGPGSM